ncbi:hypothetical protein OMP43_09180 [Sphingomonas sp. CBMAI 2297]|uniref:hypothetical protein n=1 Tax=Sphingomonas sp. CBMAI 2297 TaxID=2991720 RepID=UPI0024552796|nr:hypothetical protein [Sphingomonas sp. CBMAI 2297]MDH4744187.1 hypothetical protein [Sphingomonas sp. CBMAI 2297]
MIDEMYDRAWVGHRERFSQDAQLLLRKAGAMLRSILEPRRQSAKGSFAASIGEREREVPAAADEGLAQRVRASRHRHGVSADP